MLRKTGRTRGGWRYLAVMSWWWDALGWMVAEGLASHLSSGALCDCPIAFWWGPGTSDWSTHSLCPITCDSNARQMMQNVGWFLLPFSESWSFCFVWGQGLPSVLLLNSVAFHVWKRPWHQSGRGTLGPSHRRDWLLFLFLFLHVFLNQSLKQNDIRNGNSRDRWGHLVKENSWEKATGTRASFQSSQTIHLHVAEGSRVTPNTVIQGPLNGLLGEFRTPEVNGSSKWLISHLLILGVSEPSLPILLELICEQCWAPEIRYYSTCAKKAESYRKEHTCCWRPEILSFSGRGPLSEIPIRTTCRKPFFIWIFQEGQQKIFLSTLTMKSMERVTIKSMQKVT